MLGLELCSDDSWVNLCLFLIGGRESRHLSFAACWKYKLGLCMKHDVWTHHQRFQFLRVPSSTQQVVQNPNGFCLAPQKLKTEREREFSCSKSQTLNQTLSRGTFSVIIHFYSNLFPYGSTFQLFDPNFRDVSVG